MYKVLLLYLIAFLKNRTMLLKN
ncbi:hypothetical protein CAJAP_05146 [Camponotus japonicus]